MNQYYYVYEVEKSLPKNLKKLFIALCISELKAGFAVIKVL